MVVSSTSPVSASSQPAVMSEVKAQLPPLLEDIAGLGDAPENLLWKPQNTEVCSHIEFKIFLVKI